MKNNKKCERGGGKGGCDNHQTRLNIYNTTTIIML